MKKLIVIADWAHDSFTNQEVRTTVEGFLKNPASPNISFVATTPSTIHTAYIIEQMVETEERFGRPLETVFFQNTDPRIQTEMNVEPAKGAEFLIIKLAAGIFICGPNAGYNFSMIRHKIEKVYTYTDVDKVSQFRSRDLYARVCAHLMDSMEDDLELEEISPNVIPGLEGHYVGHIDNFANIKTTIRHEELKGKYELHDEVKVSLNGITKSLKYVSGLFGGDPGELVIYPGSTGKIDDPYMEISIWRNFTEGHTSTGAQAFDNPLPGMEIVIQI